MGIVFNIEEVSIMSYYDRSSKEVLINELEGIVEHIEDEEMKKLVEEIIIKLKNISEEDYKEIDFSKIIEVEDENEIEDNIRVAGAIENNVIITLCYRLEKEAKCGEDENGEFCEAYLQVKEQVSKEISEEGYRKVHEAYRKIISNNLDVKREYIIPISLNEYLNNIDK